MKYVESRQFKSFSNSIRVCMHDVSKSKGVQTIWFQEDQDTPEPMHQNQSQRNAVESIVTSVDIRIAKAFVIMGIKI